jgi:hypothetical protein
MVSAPVMAAAQVRVSTANTALQPASPWTFRGAAGIAGDGVEASSAGPHVSFAVERTVSDRWSVRLENRVNRTHYDPSAIPAPVTSATQLDIGGAMVRILDGSSLGHVYAGFGASFLLMSFTGIEAPRNKAVGVHVMAGLEVHPASRRWGAFAEMFIQGRSRPPEFSDGYLWLAQIGIGFGVTLPIARAHQGR